MSDDETDDYDAPPISVTFEKGLETPPPNIDADPSTPARPYVVRELPRAAGAFTGRQRGKLARKLPWLPETAEIGERIDALKVWAQAEAEDIATRGDGVTAPSVVALLSEAAADLAHAGELRKIAMRHLAKGGDQGERQYARYVGLASRLGDAAGLHMVKARLIAAQTKARATWVDPTDKIVQAQQETDDGEGGRTE